MNPMRRTILSKLMKNLPNIIKTWINDITLTIMPEPAEFAKKK